MEDLVRLADTNGFLYATAIVFTFWVILWLVWARFFQENVIFHKVCQFVLAGVLLMLFFAFYASAVAGGLDGRVCAAGRFSARVICYTHDESSLLFWALVTWLMTFFVLLMLITLAFLVQLVAPRGQRAITTDGGQRRFVSAGEWRPGGAAKGWTAWQALLLVWGVIVISNLAWIGNSLRQVSVARKQVTEALASVAHEKSVVEDYLRGHGGLPENNEAAGLLSPVELHSQYFSEIGISKGSVLMKFDETSVDEHLAGRVLTLIALRRGTTVSWLCATPEIDDKFLPDSCRSGL